MPHTFQRRYAPHKGSRRIAEYAEKSASTRSPGLVATHRGGDVARDLAAVERVRPARRDALQHRGILRVLQQRSRGLRLAVGQVEIAARVGVEREKPVGGDQRIQTRRDRKSFLREADRRLEEFRPGKFAVPAVRELEQAQQARHAHGFAAYDGRWPVQRTAIGAEKAPGLRAGGRGLPAVVGFELRVARGVVQQESAAADSGGLRFHQTEHELGCNRRVDRAPALADRVVPGARGKRMRRDHHEALRGDERLRGPLRGRLGRRLCAKG